MGEEAGQAGAGVPPAPALEIRRKIERCLEKLWSLHDEARVREQLASLNAEIGKTNATVTSGPPTQVGLLDEEAIVERWRALREDQQP